MPVKESASRKNEIIEILLKYGRWAEIGHINTHMVVSQSFETIATEIEKLYNVEKLETSRRRTAPGAGIL